MQKQMTNQEAIETLEIFRDDYTREDSAICQSIDISIDSLKHPTIEPEVRHGSWIEETEPDENGNVIAMCNQCYHTGEHGVNMKIPYCWYCGSRMDLTNTNVYEKE